MGFCRISVTISGFRVALILRPAASSSAPRVPSNEVVTVFRSPVLISPATSPEFFRVISSIYAFRVSIRPYRTICEYVRVPSASE